MPKKKSTKKNISNKGESQTTNKTKWSVVQQPTELHENFRKVFWIIFAVIAVVTILMALQTGINEDEKFHYAYSDKLVDFYTTFGEDKAALSVEKGKMHLYGGFIDTSTRILNGIFGFEQNEAGFHNVRHFLLALIGMLSFLFAGLIGKHIGGWRMGIITMVILFLAPRFLGHTGINPRDMPFASGYIMSIYFMMRFFGEIPKVSWKTILGLAGGIGLALGARSGALLLIAYFGLFGIIHLYLSMKDPNIKNEKLLISYIKPGIIASILGYVFALLFWPYGLTSPINNVLNSIREFSNFSTVLRMLFGGEMQWSNLIPPTTYITTWLTIAMPLLMLLGVVLFILFSRGVFRKHNRFYVGMVAFVFLFPIAYIFSKQSNLYTAMRHILFVVPPLAILGGIGWDYIIGKFKNEKPALNYTSIGAFGLLSLFPLGHIATNFSTCYVYFNELQGGVAGALGKYEMDYWGTSVKRAVHWMENEGLLDTDQEIRIASNSDFVLKRYVDPFDNVKTRYARFRERYQKDWDYAIFINQFIDGAHLREGRFLDNNVIKTIGKGETPFVMIYKNPDDRLATRGFEALQNQNFDQAIQLFSQEVANNPNNENAYYGLGQAYYSKQQFNEASNAFEEVLAINPEAQGALSYNGLVLLNLNQGQRALQYFERAEKLNPRDVQSLYYQGLIYSQSNNAGLAVEKLQQAIQANPTFRQSYQLIIDIFQRQGNNAQVQYYRQLMQQYAR